MISRIWTLLPAICLLTSVTLQSASADEQVNQQAYDILQKYCGSCHSTTKKVHDFDVLDLDSLTKKRANKDGLYLEPGNVEASEIWYRMGSADRDMPPASSPQPSAEERAIVKEWILSGAKFPLVSLEERPYLDEVYTLTAIRNHLQSVPSSDREHQRYFSIVHLHNNRTLFDNKLRLYRAAFSKVVNSLHRKSSIIRPKMIDEHQTIFNIDLAKLGWDDLQLWQKVLERYPYGVNWAAGDSTLDDLTNQIRDMMGGNIKFDGVPYLRADWFISRASRPPLYNILSDLPETESALEQRLGVNVEDDFDNGQLMRAGFSESGVSRHNRVIDRHEGSNTRYYYRSIDFAKNTGKAIVPRFPLGPKFEGNEFSDSAFEHDGGEMIWRLPNGLQGYMIATSDGNRINEAPIAIVRDVREFSGTPIVVNGISCMGCHRKGIQNYRDRIGSTLTLTGTAGEKLRDLYANPEELAQTLADDQADYLRALEQAIGPFLQVGKHKSWPIERFVEPVTAVSEYYDSNLTLEEIARELNYQDPQELKVAIRGNRDAKNQGLSLLLDNATIPRAMWETPDTNGAPNVFQNMVSALDRGVPRLFGNRIGN